MDSRIIIEIDSTGDSIYVVHFDLETMRLFASFLQKLKDNVIGEFELFSNNKLYHKNIVIVIKKAVEEHHPIYSLHSNHSTLINGVFTYVMQEGMIEEWLDDVCDPWLSSNGKALIYELVWQTTVFVPVKNDPSGKTFKHSHASFIFSLKKS